MAKNVFKMVTIWPNMKIFKFKMAALSLKKIIIGHLTVIELQMCCCVLNFIKKYDDLS